MSLEPLLTEPSPIAFHALVALLAFVLGVVQLVRRKGDRLHRWIGLSWSVLLFVVAVSGLFIHQIRLWGSWSPIHLLSLLTIVTIPIGILLARSGQIRSHAITMLSLFAGALVIAGLFTFVPGRAMHAVVFGD